MPRFLDALTGSQVRLWLLAVLGVIAVGTGGYVMFFGWSIDDGRT